MSTITQYLAGHREVEVVEPCRPYYRAESSFYITVTQEVVAEWDHATDPHGYCHQRSTLVGLLAEIEHLRGIAIAAETLTWSAEYQAIPQPSIDCLRRLLREAQEQEPHDARQGDDNARGA